MDQSRFNPVRALLEVSRQHLPRHGLCQLEKCLDLLGR
jgi:hypothetical protein